VTTAAADKKRTRRSRKRGPDRVAVDETCIVEKPQVKVDRSPWTLSRPLGGRLLAHDPVFSQDER
jgi:NET1-associated nuclear protein 1 (U3 small nucleolar RNA-associated protein 17)